MSSLPFSVPGLVSCPAPVPMIYPSSHDPNQQLLSILAQQYAQQQAQQWWIQELHQVLALNQQPQMPYLYPQTGGTPVLPEQAMLDTASTLSSNDSHGSIATTSHSRSNSQCGSAHQDTAALEHRVSELEALVEQQKREMETLSVSNAEFQRKDELAKQLIITSTQEVQRLTETLETERQEAAVQAVTQLELAEQMNRLRHEKSTLQSQQVYAQSRLVSLQQEIKAERETHESVKQELEALKESHVQVQHRYHQLQETQSKISAHNKEQKKKLSKANKRLAQSAWTEDQCLKFTELETWKCKLKNRFETLLSECQTAIKFLPTRLEWWESKLKRRQQELSEEMRLGMMVRLESVLANHPEPANLDLMIREMVDDAYEHLATDTTHQAISSQCTELKEQLALYAKTLEAAKCMYQEQLADRQTTITHLQTQVHAQVFRAQR